MTEPSPNRLVLESSLVALLFAVFGIGGVIYGARSVRSVVASVILYRLGIGDVIYGARTWMPELASRHGAGIDLMLDYLLVTVGALFLIGYVALAVLIWRGARRVGVGRRVASRRAELALSGALGLGMALVAEGGVLTIGIPVWSEYFDAAPSPDAIEIDVTAQQFMWNVRYPGPDGRFGRTSAALMDDTTNALGLDPTDPTGRDDVVTANEITVPANRLVRIRLHSKDVIHSFFLPNFRVKQDAVPGMSPEVMFLPTRLGNYELACAELCGLAHYRMRGFFNVVTQAEFDEWLRMQKEQQ